MFGPVTHIHTRDIDLVDNSDPTSSMLDTLLTRSTALGALYLTMEDISHLQHAIAFPKHRHRTNNVHVGSLGRENSLVSSTRATT